ncbi:M14 family metallopeptidase [Novosphingobium sp. UBA1939]|uniref:M14 family metallopeptidase n=1 Tax=Novosphingobium sp. UBA1939 TaxID=1946982 RepID=UPI0039C8E037
MRLVFENAAEAAYPDGWPGYRCVASYDRRNWFRIGETRFENGQLIVEHTPERNSIYYAYFEPYSHERHLDLLGRVEMSPYASVSNLGATVDGRDLDLVTIGRPMPGKLPIWIIARQHPGESMAEWWMEGALDLLTDPADPHGRKLRQLCRFHIVPNMNPDGSRRGHLRTNAAGVNLNREWDTPSAERSPEVLCVRDAMDETGVHFAIDVHGDEAIPAVFLAGFEGIPSWTEQQGAEYRRYRAILERRTPDFQTRRGYPVAPAGKANLSMSTNQLAERFGASHGCVSMTLEMPFKDNADLPDPAQGWSPERSKLLGRECLAALLELLLTRP